MANPPTPSLDVDLNPKIRVIVSGPQHVTCAESDVEIVTGEQVKEEALGVLKWAKEKAKREKKEKKEKKKKKEKVKGKP